MPCRLCRCREGDGGRGYSFHFIGGSLCSFPFLFAAALTFGTLHPGELARLSELEAALLAEAPQPLPAVCPTATRYAVAKYDSSAVDKAYAALRRRFAGAGTCSNVPRLVLPDGTSPDLAEAVLRAAGAAFPDAVIVLSANAEVRQLAAKLGVSIAAR